MKLLRFLLTIFHLAVLALLLGTLLNAYISPQTIPVINLLSLTFPVLMLINVFLCILWIILWKKRAFLFLILSVPLAIPAMRWVNYKSKIPEKANLKVVSMNVKAAQYGKEELTEYLKNTGADVILAQEYGKKLNIPGYENRVEDYSIVSLHSTAKIIAHKKLATTGNGNSFYADIEVNGKVIRFINVYLNPFSFDKNTVKPVEDFDQNQSKVKYVLKKLIPTFKIHQEEIEGIREGIEQSPYPVIVAGDFNAVPNSYEYYHLGKGLKDAFLETGRGSATSFHDYKFPIRIDYIFSSNSIKPISYSVDRSLKLSDHYPVIAEFKID